MSRTSENTVRREWLEKDFYDVLGVGKDASAKDIKKAYRKLAQQYHPDTNSGDAAAEALFKDISEAYATLGDEEQRKQYDEAREAFARGTWVGGGGGGRQGAQYVRVEDVGNLEDLFGGFGFGDIFGGGGGGRSRQRTPRKGADVDAQVHLSFHEAIAGVTKEVYSPDGSTKVKIPKGVANGAKIRLRGKGEPGSAGGPRGDLYVNVTVGSHPVFERKGSDLLVNVPITFTEAVLGADISVPTLDGKVTLRVPAGTQPGRTLRVSGRGIETTKRKGDLLVTVSIDVPTSLTDEQREALDTYASVDTSDPRKHLGT